MGELFNRRTLEKQRGECNHGMRWCGGAGRPPRPSILSEPPHFHLANHSTPFKQWAHELGANEPTS